MYITCVVGTLVHESHVVCTTITTGNQRGGASASLRGKHVLRVAVVVAVALEALAQASGGIARAAVGALRDVLVRGAGSGFRDGGVAETVRGEALHHVQVVVGGPC